ncbi:ribosome small subunit-dependent GTPase A [Alkalicella caledoniensis]|uniref:Small ribosomal subunit biogenesis GTPase RsgA n=1 Tax=Alkalicella caledoniensis TaxID=2731377 RepID=A0A7G9W7K6_ALKCA|nr:ribosome small subunit-dependent GTPase A [Alkalicella caledoniensis]QNO14668.1 ribosome small subunit-dependent GTPase A [Alkalicella caledoniensis]
MTNNQLQKIGWNEFFKDNMAVKLENTFPARVIAQKGDVYTLLSEQGEHNAKVTGKFRFNTKQVKDFPVVGDFVIVGKAKGSDNIQIHELLDRKNSFSRKMPISGGRKLKDNMIDGGVTEEQVIAANLDVIFVICGLDGNFSIPRLERYLALIRHQNLNVAILLNKLDLCENMEEKINEVSKIAGNAPVLAVSALTKQGIGQLSEYITCGKTIAFVGSSGVGKSTLLNSLFEDQVQITNTTSDHSGKGKHTTTHRQMFFHQTGCMIIDTPGMKELQLWADEEDISTVYQAVIDTIARCKFSNCTHDGEPGCAIKDALDSGELSEQRYIRYKKSLKEVRRLEERKREYKNKKMKRGR